jgi:hypothetical protein
MRLILFAALLLTTASVSVLAAPTASACPGNTGGCFGTCWIVYAEVGVTDGQGQTYYERVPRGLECAW